MLLGILSSVVGQSTANPLQVWVNYDSPRSTLRQHKTQDFESCYESCQSWDGTGNTKKGDKYCIVATYRESDGTCWLKAPQISADWGAVNYENPADVPFLSSRVGFKTALTRLPSYRATTTERISSTR